MKIKAGTHSFKEYEPVRAALVAAGFSINRSEGSGSWSRPPHMVWSHQVWTQGDGTTVHESHQVYFDRDANDFVGGSGHVIIDCGRVFDALKAVLEVKQ